MNRTTFVAACGASRGGVGDREGRRIYDLRSTFASNALAAGVTVFELAKVMGSSVAMIERHYGTLLDGAGAGSPDAWTRTRRNCRRTMTPTNGGTRELRPAIS